MKKRVLAIILSVALLASAIVGVDATTGSKSINAWFNNISVILDGKTIALKDAKGNSVEPFTINGTTYLPVRALAEAMGLNVEWDPSKDGAEVILSTGRNSSFVLPKKVDKSTQPRVLITTDLEVDDINGILLTLMYANEYDIAGLVATAGMFHFEGDGVHTLAEITPNYKCEVGTIGGTIENAGQLKSFRPAEPHILERLVNVNYRADYEYLSKNDPNYPTPDELLSVVKTGNVQFEGDVREATEGSDWIKQCILDNDPRTLYITHWGGSNTTVRAMLDIYNEYHGTAQWDSILKKVVDKVCFMGTGEDNCVSDQGILEKFPGLQTKGAPSSFFSYGQFFSAVNTEGTDLYPYYQGEYLTEAFKLNHGMIMGEFHLMGDGQVIYGEPYVYQYGLTTDMFWHELWDLGYSVADYVNLPVLNASLDRYDWMCCQFTTAFIESIGLRHDVTNKDDHYTAIMFDELAARADWAILPAANCNHAPVVTTKAPDHTAKAGATVNLAASATDPDGDKLNITWWVPANACTYAGESELAVVGSGETAQFTVPTNAAAGDKFVVNMEVQDTGVERPMTRFAQFVITVTK